MHPAPLQLEKYFVSDLHFAVNRAFEKDRETVLKYEDLVVEPVFMPDQQDAGKWQVTLRAGHQPATTVNSPYSFTIEVVGLFLALPTYPHDKERLVKTNAPTILYGIVREVVRNLTASGPHKFPVLPSVSFFEPLPQPAKPATS